MGDSSRMRRSCLLATLTAMAWPAGAATVVGSGRPATEAREVGDFNAIVLRGGIDLMVRQAARVGLQVQADDNLLPLLRTSIETIGGQPTLLVQWATGNSVRSRSKAVVTVDVVRLDRLTAQGSGDIVVGALKTPALALAIAGSSDARLEALEAAQVQLSIAGSGDIAAAGRTERLEVSITGSGDVSAFDLSAGDATVSIAGSGSVRVHAGKTLAVSISGSGDVEYRGGAVLSRSRVAGSGTIRSRP